MNCIVVNLLKHNLLLLIICAGSDIDDGSLSSGLIISVITNLLGHILADSDGNLLVDSMALLLWHLLALGQGLVEALLVRNVSADSLWHISAGLLWHLVAHWIGHLPLLGLGHILALIIGIVPAGAGDGHPDLVVAAALPLVLAVLFVLGGADCLGVGLILCLVLVNTHILVHCAALLLIDGVALEHTNIQ